MQQKYTKFIFIGVLGFLAIFFTLTRPKRELPDQRPPVEIKNTPPVDQAPPSQKSKALNKNLETKVFVNVQQDQKKGFCIYAPNQKENFLSDEITRHLRQNNPQFLALPSFHSDCIADARFINFRIVSYDSILDSMTNYWGTISASLKKEEKGIPIESFINSPSLDSRKFGFTSKKQFLAFLFQLGSNSSTMLNIFKVGNVGLPNTRDRSGAYEFYPGVRFVQWSAVQGVAKSSEQILISTTPIPKSVKLGMAKREINLDRIAQLPVVDSGGLLRRQGPIDLKDLKASQQIFIVGVSVEDPRPLGLASYLLNQGFTNLNYISGGFTELLNLPLNPFSENLSEKLPSLKFESINLKDFAVIDTRPNTLRMGLEINNAYLAPVALPVETVAYHRQMRLLNGKKRAKILKNSVRFIDLERIQNIAKMKRVLFIGRNDSDLAPQFIYENIKNKQRGRYFVLNEGFDGLMNKNQLGILNKENASLVRPSFNRTILLSKLNENGLILVKRKWDTK